MKKTLLILAFSFPVFLSNLVLSQANFTGNIIISPYYGFPNFGSLTLPSSELHGTNAKFNSLGPLGIRAEYMISEKIGLGIDVIYNSYNLTFTSESSVYNGNLDQWVTQDVKVEKSMQRIRIQARYNYHFKVSNPSNDWYFGLGVGSNSRIFKYFENGVKTTDPGTSNQSDTSQVNFTGSNVFPISTRVCFGYKHYLTSNWAGGIEIGLGGPIISAGITYKIF